MNAGDFDFVQHLALRLGFRTEFVRPGPSTVRGVQVDRSRIYARFVRDGDGKGRGR